MFSDVVNVLSERVYQIRIFHLLKHLCARIEQCPEKNFLLPCPSVYVLCDPPWVALEQFSVDHVLHLWCEFPAMFGFDKWQYVRVDHISDSLDITTQGVMSDQSDKLQDSKCQCHDELVFFIGETDHIRQINPLWLWSVRS
ncbi:hypothetical protein [Salmon gill poxvirus]|nr:hypothetical protein [Salmon gill poxvirus]